MGVNRYAQVDELSLTKWRGVELVDQLVGNDLLFVWNTACPWQ